MAQISLRIDDEVKKTAEQVCDDMSTEIVIYLKKLGREKRIPFELTADSFYSTENMAILDKRISDIKAGKNVSEHELIEVE